LAVPMKVESIDGMSAVANSGGTQLNINAAFIDDLSVGDYVLVHAGFAIKKIDRNEAQKTISILNDLISSTVDME